MTDVPITSVTLNRRASSIKDSLSPTLFLTQWRLLKDRLSNPSCHKLCPLPPLYRINYPPPPLLKTTIAPPAVSSYLTSSFSEMLKIAVLVAVFGLSLSAPFTNINDIPKEYQSIPSSLLLDYHNIAGMVPKEAIDFLKDLTPNDKIALKEWAKGYGAYRNEQEVAMGRRLRPYYSGYQFPQGQVRPPGREGREAPQLDQGEGPSIEARG